MLPFLVSLLVTLPILVLGIWLYLRRRSLSPRIRIILMSIVFLFVVISGPVIFWMLRHDGASAEILSTGRGGRQVLGQFPILWLIGVFTVGADLFRLWRKKGEL
jgi:hypothetical protein